MGDSDRTLQRTRPFDPGRMRRTPRTVRCEGSLSCHRWDQWSRTLQRCPLPFPVPQSRQTSTLELMEAGSRCTGTPKGARMALISEQIEASCKLVESSSAIISWLGKLSRMPLTTAICAARSATSTQQYCFLRCTGNGRLVRLGELSECMLEADPFRDVRCCDDGRHDRGKLCQMWHVTQDRL